MIKKRVSFALLTCAFVFLVSSGILMITSDTPDWPQVKHEQGYDTLVRRSLEQYKEKGYTPPVSGSPYTTHGKYLHYQRGNEGEFASMGIPIQYDSMGIPMREYSGVKQYTPVLTAQHALSEYNEIVSGNETARDRFVQLCDFLIHSQGEDGAFRYWFKWRYYLTKETYNPGWISGMAQGQALSALSRAYLLTGQEKYLNSAKAAFKFLIIPKERGGPMVTLRDLAPSLDDFIFFEEYISTPANYTLNGYMFALIGIYDYIACLGKEGEVAVAQYYFDKGMETLVNILPYYDLRGFSCYDLGHYTFPGKPPHIGVGYHNVHIYLLQTLSSIYRDDRLTYYIDRWTKDVEDREKDIME